MRFRLLLATMLFVAAQPLAALAAPVPPAAIDISVHDEQSGTILLVAGQLPLDTKLPAQMELAVPRGAQLQWAGELLGGEASADPEAEYTKRTEGDNDIYTLTLRQAPQAQVEVIAPGLVTRTATGGRGQLEWTPIADVDSARISFRIPVSAKITEPAEGAELFPQQSGYSFYSRQLTDVKKGEPVLFAFAYEVGVPAAGAGVRGTNNQVVPILLLALVVAFGVVVIVSIRRKMAVRRSGHADACDMAVATGTKDTGETVGAVDSPGAQPADDGPGQGPGRPAGNRKALAIVGGLVAAAIAAMFFAANASQSARTLGDEIVREYAQGDPCTSTTLQLKLENKDTADQVFAALEGAQILKATLDPRTGQLEVDFCDSQSSEEAIRGVLQPLGVLTE